MPKTRKKQPADLNPVVREFTEVFSAAQPLVVVETTEETRALEAIREAAEFTDGRQVFEWRSSCGITRNGFAAIDESDDGDGQPQAIGARIKDPDDEKGNVPDEKIASPSQALKWLAERDMEKPTVLVIMDVGDFLNPASQKSQLPLRRQLRDAVFDAKCRYRTIILMGTAIDLGDDLRSSAVWVDIPLPNRDVIRTLFDGVMNDHIDAVKAASKDDQFKVHKPNEDAIGTIVDSALGLTEGEVETAFTLAWVKGSERIDTSVVSMMKKQTIKRSGILEFIDVQNIPEVGGMDALVDWLMERRHAFTKKARDYQLPTPKGVMIPGVPGCGKSLLAKRIAQIWEYPLIRLDVGRLFGGLVGESERNMRKAISTVESVSPCILWIN